MVKAKNLSDEYEYRRNGEACLQFAAVCDDDRRIFWLEMAQKWFRLADALGDGSDRLSALWGYDALQAFNRNGSDGSGVGER